uniref:Protein kinase domain-containing protein n=1 Tax=Compsopogon caeruleus TaxID=31354 RepID=A0A7S1TI29_9RHOD|mmetsp:Transcript_87/g.147  ORF Transcript_87/g.147 Transcript_87/m.147 type:complete len:346 (+) Transcript_87:345-1382(+)
MKLGGCFGRESHDPSCHRESTPPRSRRSDIAQEPESPSILNSPKLDEKYTLGHLLGEGNFAQVFMGYQKGTSEPVAIKKFYHRPNDGEMKRAIGQELEFFKLGLEHEFIVKTYEVVRDDATSCLVLEIMAGQDLQVRLDLRDRFHEGETREILVRIFAALSFLHSNGVMHRDIKPENILFSSDTDNRAKLADFGLCHIFPKDGSRLKTDGMYGTPYYVAPEIARDERYTAKVDMWSCGVMMYQMLGGKLPFNAMTGNGVIRKVRKGNYNFNDPQWGTVSLVAKDLISKLMEVDPEKRYSAEQALHHPWIQDGVEAAQKKAKLPESMRSPHRVVDANFSDNGTLLV